MSPRDTMRVLLADDDEDNRTIAKLILEKAGYHIIEATQGLEAVEMALQEKPNLILLDLSMPKLSGWEVAKRLRQDQHTNHIPIVAFTAHVLVGDKMKAKSSGCDDYLTKPCHPNEILDKVGYWLKVA